MDSKQLSFRMFVLLALVGTSFSQEILKEVTTAGPIEGLIPQELQTLAPRLRGSCNPSNCKSPSCRCMDIARPLRSTRDEIPQFVMLTFDDAVTVANFPSYMDYLHERMNKANGCPASATFFVSHDYTNYQLVHELHRRGHEIAVHSIT